MSSTKIDDIRRQGKYYFLSRPRRFGKSLFLSTLAAFYEGRRELFKGLAADSSDWDWQPIAVLYVDLNTGEYSTASGLREKLDDLVQKWEAEYDIEPKTESPAVRFGNVITRAYELTGRRVVILVDEYDKPLLSSIDDEERTELFRSQLKAFYSNLKTMDRCIEMGFITGVARFGKVSVFSDLNNLNDISMVGKYSDICGWTEQELVDNFRTGIQNLADTSGESFEETLGAMRRYYDGYRFTHTGSRLYNPFSVLNALDHEEIMPYWFATGTPTFLAKKIRRINMPLYELNKQRCRGKELLQVGIGSNNPIPLLFQTGYLTIVGYSDETKIYDLGFPNYEVEEGFNDELLQFYMPEPLSLESQFSIEMFTEDLAYGHPERFMQRLGTLLKEMPCESHEERTYQNLVYLICRLSGTCAQMERDNYRGRPDLEVYTRRYIYVFEFKYNRTVREAMDQLHERDYAGRFAMDSRKVYLIGANFSDHAPDKGLTAYEIEELR